MIAYPVFLASILYVVGFAGNWVVPKSIDSPAVSGSLASLLTKLLLLRPFAVQHSVMARPGFKARWTKVISRSIERSTYVLISNPLLLLLFWQWRPMHTMIWDAPEGVGRIALTALSWLGWLIVLLSTFMISHFDLFGLRQVILNLQGEAYQHPGFATRDFYQIVQHPIMLGFIIAFWASPAMTLGHLVFALATTSHILIALQLEERDLIADIGHAYTNYRKRVPMLVPWPRSSQNGNSRQLRYTNEK